MITIDGTVLRHRQLWLYSINEADPLMSWREGVAGKSKEVGTEGEVWGGRKDREVW